MPTGSSNEVMAEGWRGVTGVLLDDVLSSKAILDFLC